MNYTDLHVWNESFQLSKDIYALTDAFPSSERHGLIPQMRRAALSIPCNIAEGSRRSTKKDYRHFCFVAFGSASEFGSAVAICSRNEFRTNKCFHRAIRKAYKNITLVKWSLSFPTVKNHNPQPTTYNPIPKEARNPVPL